MRTVPEEYVLKWSEMIEQMEDQVAAILQEERFSVIPITCLPLGYRFFFFWEYIEGFQAICNLEFFHQK